MAWSATVIYYKHTLSGLVATHEDPNYPVSNLLNRIEGTLYKSTLADTPQYVTYDAGSGNTYTADYFWMANHNLYTAGATLVLQYSSDNFASDIHDAFTAFAPTSNRLILKTFGSVAARYWRIKITNCTVIPYVALAQWGPKTILDFNDGDLDPYEDEIKANVNVADTGYLQGIYSKQTALLFTLQFDAADDALYQKVRDWHTAVGLSNFVVAWEPTDHATDFFLMRAKDGKLHAPLQNGGIYRDIRIPLIGRKET